MTNEELNDYNVMGKQVLSVEQMQHLKELGLKLKSTMCYYTRIKGDENDKWDLTTVAELSEYMFEQIPAYTLQDILDVLPKKIPYFNSPYWLEMGLEDEEEWYMTYREDITGPKAEYIYGKEFIDVAYKVLCWAIENGYVETNKKR